MCQQSQRLKLEVRLAAASSHDEARRDPLLQVSGEGGPCRPLDFGLLVSIRQHISVVWKHPVGGSLLPQA